MGTIRGLVTLALMTAFVAMVIWLAGKGNKHRFDAAARMPLEDDSSIDSRSTSSAPKIGQAGQAK